RDAEWLASLLCRLMPDEPEPIGLLALVRLHLARWAARVDAAGRLVLLEHQDRSLWDQRAISQAVALIERTAAFRRPGRDQIEAMSAALHSEAPSWDVTDWRQLMALYSVLTHVDSSPGVALSRAIARRYVDGAAPGLADVDELSDQLREYHLFHATRAALLRELGHADEAAREDAVALALTRNTGERA